MNWLLKAQFQVGPLLALWVGLHKLSLNLSSLIREMALIKTALLFASLDEQKEKRANNQWESGL